MYLCLFWTILFKKKGVNFPISFWMILDLFNFLEISETKKSQFFMAINCLVCIVLKIIKSIRKLIAWWITDSSLLKSQFKNGQVNFEPFESTSISSKNCSPSQNLENCKNEGKQKYCKIILGMFEAKCWLAFILLDMRID